jgi:hypothetical protein
MNLRRKLTNLRKNDPRLSTCAHCGGAWNWKKPHDIPYHTSGERQLADGSPYYDRHMFPVCTDCYEILSPRKRYNYCVRLFKSWNSPEKEIDWNVIAEYVGLKKDE